MNLGNIFYVAPELRCGLTTDKVDIYSIGAMYLEIFLPFHDRFKGLYALMSGNYSSGWANYAVDVEFLMKLTSLDPSDRLSINEVLVN
uniref:Protein kinase domain-containing protein n=1 Tax=Oryza punctata TaxID=4537 RepID=A0A0E0JPI5_ORYPU